MEYKRLGNTGLKVSCLSYGAWVSFSTQLGVDKAYEIMKAAYEGGVNFFDNAETYANGEAETIMGQAVAKGIQENLWERTDLVLSTKIYFGTGKRVPNATGLSRKHIIEGMKGSLARFGLDYVDLVFCHRPDENTPIEETVRAMNWVIDQGWAFYWGTSEWSAAQFKEACEIADRLGLIPPHFEQPQYNLLHREKVENEFAELYKSRGMGLTIWSPLASGVLTGKYSNKVVEDGSRLALKDYEWLKNIKMEKEKDIEKADLMKPIADEIGCTRAQLAIAWCVKNKNVTTTILGASKVEQIRENLKSLEFVDKITEEHGRRLDEIFL